MSKEYKSVKWIKSISFKVPILFILSFIIIALFVVSILYAWTRNYMIDEYRQMGEGVTRLMQMEVDPDRVDEYIEKNFELEDYNRIMDRFYALKDSYPNILYMYVYRIKPENADVVFDLDSEFGKDANAPGDVYELDDVFKEHIDDLVVGNEVPLLSGNTPDGYLLTYCRPLFKSDGSYSCHVCVDFSMEKLKKRGMLFTLQVMMFLCIAIILVLLGDIYMIRRVITTPIGKLYTALGNFKYETENDQSRSIRAVKNVNINTGDEIQVLYDSLVSVMENGYNYMKNLNIARKDIEHKEEIIGEISKTAYEDPLTGAGSKAAYDKEYEILEREFAEGNTKFAILVCDINDLKYINDTFGHEAGNSYITGCVETLRRVYANSSIFRIGGDEFTVILKDKEYAERHEKYKQITASFKKTCRQKGKNPWERYAMSVGMDEVKADDKCLDDVFKRADEKMYKNKRAYKAKYGSYR